MSVQDGAGKPKGEISLFTVTAVEPVDTDALKKSLVFQVKSLWSGDYYAPAPTDRGINRWCASDVCRFVWRLSRTSGLSRETPRKTKISTVVAHVTRDSDTTVKVNRLKISGGGIVWRSHYRPHSLLCPHLGSIKRWCCLTSVCLTHCSGKRVQQLKKT